MHRVWHSAPRTAGVRAHCTGWRAAWACGVALLAGCASLPGGAPERTQSHGAAVVGDDLIVVAVTEATQPRPAAGGAARADYRLGADYAGSDHARAQAATLAAAHGLSEVKAWTIQALNWRCMLYRMPAGGRRDAVLAQLQADPRVQLAQALNSFETLSDNRAGSANGTPAYNDPYLALQNGFATIDAAGAQRVSRGERVTVAVIDTGIDADHPDLQGRVSGSRDFVGRAMAGEHHGTEVAGVIAAMANNGKGIVGVAPGARLLSLRACWAEPGSSSARCNSFTLAEALAAAIAANVDIINLSLGGPRDPLLERLALYAMARGIVVVGALPPGGRRTGFPSALPGVLAVASSEDGAAAPQVLTAPGRHILTLAPGGGYDCASGSSLATAHVSGAVALLRSIDSTLSADALDRLLSNPATPGQAINACRAAQRLRPAVQCTAVTP